MKAENDYIIKCVGPSETLEISGQEKKYCERVIEKRVVIIMNIYIYYYLNNYYYFLKGLLSHLERVVCLLSILLLEHKRRQLSGLQRRCLELCPKLKCSKWLALVKKTKKHYTSTAELDDPWL